MFPQRLRGERKHKAIENALFIDPGLEGTGWAFYRKLWTDGEPLFPPVSWDVVKPKRSVQWESRVAHVCAWLDGTLASLGARVVVNEFAGFWSGSAVGMASAAKGDLSKLLYLTGGLGEVVRRHEIIRPVLVTPAEWKGQLPKPAVIKRIERRWPEIQNIANHAADAVGMGLAAQGRL